MVNWLFHTTNYPTPISPKYNENKIKRPLGKKCESSPLYFYKKGQTCEGMLNWFRSENGWQTNIEKKTQQCTISNKTASTDHQKSRSLEQTGVRKTIIRKKLGGATSKRQITIYNKSSWRATTKTSKTPRIHRMPNKSATTRRQHLQEVGRKSVLKEDCHLKNFLQKSINERREKRVE